MAAAFGKVIQAQLPMILERVTPQIEARVKQSLQNVGSQSVVSQIPMLIETAGPQLEGMLREKLRTMNPQQASMFLESWKRLDMTVRQELGRGYGGKRKTRRRKSRR